MENYKTLTLAVMLIIFTVLPGTILAGIIPIYIVILCISLLLVTPSILLKTYPIYELKFYVFQLFFVLLIGAQYILIGHKIILLSLLSILSGIAIILVTKNSIENKNQLIIIIKLFIILHILGGFIAIMQAFFGIFYPSEYILESNKGLWYKPAGFEPMSFSFGKNYIFLAIFSFVAIQEKLYLKTVAFSKIFLFFIFYFSVFIVILSQNRSTQLALLILLIGHYLLSQKNNFLMSFIKIILVIIILVAIFIFNLDHLLDGSTYSRLVLWYAGLHMFIDNPFVGVGMGMFKEFYQHYKEALDFIPYYDQRIMDPHNLILGLITGGGVIGFILVVFAFKQFHNYLKSYQTKDSLLIVMVKAILFYFIAFLIDFQFHNYWNDNNFWFFIGVAFSLGKINDKEIRKSARPLT